MSGHVRIASERVTMDGRRSGGVMRLRRERRGEDWRECSTSEEERDRELYSSTGLSSILTGYVRKYMTDSDNTIC